MFNTILAVQAILIVIVMSDPTSTVQAILIVIVILHATLTVKKATLPTSIISDEECNLFWSIRHSRIGNNWSGRK